MKKFLIPLLFALAIVGCTVNVQLPPTVIATTVPTETATATATPVPTVTAAPTPTATPANIVDRSIFVETQLMRIHIWIDLSTGNYDISGVPAEESLPSDEVVQTQYDLLLIYEQYGYFDTNIIDRIMGEYERNNFEEVQALNRARIREPWRHTGNLFEEN